MWECLHACRGRSGDFGPRDFAVETRSLGSRWRHDSGEEHLCIRPYRPLHATRTLRHARDCVRWPTASRVIVLAVIAVVIAFGLGVMGVRRWVVVPPQANPQPFDPLPLPWWSTVGLTAGLGAALVTAVAGLVPAWFALVVLGALVAVLTDPLRQVARTSADITEAERRLAAIEGARGGHRHAHSEVTPMEGRLLRAAAEADELPDAPLAAELRSLAARCRSAEESADARGEALVGSSVQADSLRAMLAGVRGRPSRLFSDDASMPSTWGARRRALWRPFAARLDDARAVHTHQIEWIALYATLWLRPTILLALPLLPAEMTAGIQPLTDGATTSTVAWALALTSALITAGSSWWLVPRVQRKDVPHIPLCERLLAVETPLWAFLVGAAPSWAAWTFGAGPFTWAERPHWRTRRAVVLAAAGVVGLAVSLVMRHASAGAIAIECLVAATATFLMATSYGLLLPLAVDRLLFSNRRQVAARRRLEDALAAEVDRELDDAIDRAVAACRNAPLGPAGRELQAAAAARHAELERGTRRRSGRRLWPRTATVGEILVDAAVPLVPGQIDPDAHVSLRRAVYDPDRLEHARVAREHRVALTRAWKSILAEADRHGIGEIAVEISLAGDRLRLAISNLPDPADPPGGRRRGAEIMAAELLRLPGGELLQPPLATQRRREGSLTTVWVTIGECSAAVLEAPIHP